ncbi:MAG TPA: hypothetical protein VFX04_03815 [Rhodanobacteraceae bacterium]|jgi:hypothetical protein|nr:hypothetical protein [Rhodanobacteraceae bacterium]
MDNPHRSMSNRLARMALCVLLAGAWYPAFGAQCPKLLMFDGVDLRTQTNAGQAAYWGETVGVQGFFLNNVMAHWRVDVGTDPDSKLWQKASRFQSIYSKDGVTDNFIKVALYKAHDWHDKRENDAVVKRFAHAAMLARHAGFKGMALDLEPYKPTWGGPAGGPELASTVEQEGRAIGEAMHKAYPGMTLIVLPDVLAQTHRYDTLVQRFKSKVHDMKSGTPPPRYDAYELSVPFVRGLLSVPWKHVVIAMEQTYSRNAEGMGPSAQRSRDSYEKLMGRSAEAMNLTASPGLWTLGPTQRDKSARETPTRFEQRLEAAYAASKRYVWIYGKGSAWQTDGPYAPGPVNADFDQYLHVIHQVRASCSSARGAPKDRR